MTVERCEKTDLLANQCAHCRGLLDPEAEIRQSRQALLSTANWFESKWAGKCARCGDWFREGSAIHRVQGYDGYVAECCADAEDGAA